MKRLLSLILTAVIVLSLFVSCSTKSEKQQKSGNIRKLILMDYTKSAKAFATFFNSKSGKKKTVKMKIVSEAENSKKFSCKADCSVYNMVYFTSNNKKSDEAAFNKCVVGWCRTKDGLYPYIDGKEKRYKPDTKTVKLKADNGKEKKIYIWTPDGYNASSDEKYSTVYVLDGQLMMYLGMDYVNIRAYEDVTSQVRAMTKATGKKAIVVGIDNGLERDNELTPRIGEFRFEGSFGEEDDYEGMNGIELAKFIAGTLVPYIQKNYNVYTSRENTSVVGASLGGLETFYTALEYPGIFGTAGCLSPSFWAFSDEAWKEYIGKKKFSSKSPFIYFYTGNDESDVGPFVEKMYKMLKKSGYPKNKLAFHYDEKGSHSARLWRAVFSEFLTAAFIKEIKPLQNK